MSSLIEHKLLLEFQAQAGNPEALMQLNECYCARGLPVERFICINLENNQFGDAIAAVRTLADQGNFRAQEMIFRCAQVLHEPSLKMVHGWFARRDAFALEWLLTASRIFIPIVDCSLSIQIPDRDLRFYEALESSITSVSGQEDKPVTPQRMVLEVYRHYTESVLSAVLPSSWMHGEDLRKFCRDTIIMVRSLCTKIEQDLTNKVREELMQTSDMYKNGVANKVWARGQ